MPAAADLRRPRSDRLETGLRPLLHLPAERGEGREGPLVGDRRRRAGAAEGLRERKAGDEGELGGAGAEGGRLPAARAEENRVEQLLVEGPGDRAQVRIHLVEEA